MIKELIYCTTDDTAALASTKIYYVRTYILHMQAEPLTIKFQIYIDIAFYAFQNYRIPHLFAACHFVQNVVLSSTFVFVLREVRQ